MLYRDFIISAYYTHSLSIVITVSACHAHLLSIMSIIRSISCTVSLILVKTHA